MEEEAEAAPSAGGEEEEEMVKTVMMVTMGQEVQASAPVELALVVVQLQTTAGRCLGDGYRADRCRLTVASGLSRPPSPPSRPQRSFRRLATIIGSSMSTLTS